MHNNIPDEMKQFESWIVWKYEDHGEPKLRKVPYQINGKHAKSNDSSTWTNFQSVLSTYQKGQYSGIGFVLSEADPYSIVDLDDTGDNKTQLEKQKAIFKSFDSYSELSPSKTGIHIIVRGKLPPGRRRRDNIEVYTSERFMTMTGDVYHNAPINNRQELLNILVAELGNNAPVESFGKNMPQSADDETIYNKALNAVNGQKFYSLWCGHWQGIYPSQSEADQALINIIVFYTQNYDQIERLFHYSALGKRDKAHRKTYLFGYPPVNRGMVQKAFDKMVPPLDFDALRNSIDMILVNPIDANVSQDVFAPSVFNAPLPVVASPYTVPPGLVGEIANFIYNHAPLPVPEIALAGAIGFLSGICGRAYNVNGVGINQYMILIARTGRGKEAMAQGIDKIITEVKRTVPSAAEFIGPSEIASSQALNKYLSQSASFLTIQGEFGLRLSEMSGNMAPAHMVGLRRTYLDLFNKSGQGRVMGSGIWADTQKNTKPVLSPAVTILGESTPESFYSILSEGMINEGFLPRFSIIEYKGPRVELNEHAKDVNPSARLIEHVAALCNQCLILNQQNIAQQVDTAPDAGELFKKFRRGCDSEMNNTESGTANELWNRAHIKALKLAALIAVGVNPFTPVIALDVAQWAINLVACDVRNLLQRFEAGEIGVEIDEEQQTDIVKKLFVDYVKSSFDNLPQSSKKAVTQQMHYNRVMPYRLLSAKTAQLGAFKNDRIRHTGALVRTIKSLLDSGDIVEITSPMEKAKYGAMTARLFVLANVELLK